VTLASSARPRLRHARLRRRGAEWMLLAPERGFRLGGSAPAILALVDGRRSIAELVDTLAAAHGSARETVERDVVDLLRRLAHRGLVHIEP
jgi:pyrroloquinoline quinone biosynthesis protein D